MIGGDRVSEYSRAAVNCTARLQFQPAWDAGDQGRSALFLERVVSATKVMDMNAKRSLVDPGVVIRHSGNRPSLAHDRAELCCNAKLPRYARLCYQA